MDTKQLPFKFVVSDGDKSVPIIVNPKVLNGFNFTKAKTFILKRENNQTLKNDVSLDLPNGIIGGSAQVNVIYKPFNEKVFLTGLDKLVREPYGCFEQTSSSTFPMVMLLQYLNHLGEENDKTAKMKLDIEQKLSKGVKRLLGFETPTGGFEWFGKSPGHATLTAYGLWQFIEMNKLGDYVSKEVLDRTLNWLKVQFDENDEEFKFENGVDSFARPPQMISDVYILFVMTLLENYAIDFSGLLNPVLKKYTEDAFKKKDSYLLAFVGLAYINQGKRAESEQVIKKLLENAEDSGEFSSVDTSITRSRGKNLKIETTAICLILLQEVNFVKYSKQISKSIEFLQRNMEDGYFGSTQSTVLALKALTDNSKHVSSSNRKKKVFKVSVDNQDKKFTVENSSDLTNEKVSFDVSNAADKVDINSKDNMEEGEKHVFTVEYSFRLPTLIEAPDSPLSLSVSRTKGEALEKYQIQVRNQENRDQGMVMVVVHKPSYSKVNLSDLEVLRTSGTVAFYELRNNNSEMVFYWRGVKPNGTVGLELTLADEYGHFNSDPVAVGAYLYYDKDGTFVYKMLD